MQQEELSLWGNFKRFFINYFWLGVVLILISMQINEPDAPNSYWNMASRFMETIGLAVFVASLFSFTFESVSFQEKMQEIVEKIVLKRTFLNNLTNEKKKEALHHLLKPTEQEIEKYSNIEDFYNYFIDETLNVSSKNVRSNYSINLRAKYDSTSNRVYTEGIYSYRLYPSKNGYTDITVGFLKDDIESKVDVIVSLPDGNRKQFLDTALEYEETETLRKTSIKLDEECSKFKHIDVELRLKEFGQNHWENVFFKAEQATDGFKFTLYCEDGITIKTYSVFDVGHNYHIDINDDKQEIHIACHQWLNEGAGISMVISRPDDDTGIDS